MTSTPNPTGWQVRRARAITAWYLRDYYGTPSDPGVLAMFFDPARVGHFAVTPAAIAAEDGAALFRVLVATTMFQRLQDVLILRILQRMGAADVEELTTPAALLALADGCGCEHAASLQGLLQSCDLGKDPVTKFGVCGQRPELGCYLKRHTVLLKRYGHFGKVPTSLALTLREAGAADLKSLKDMVVRRTSSPLEAAVAMEDALSAVWRVSKKISNMYLSALSNPDLSPWAPWAAKLDGDHFVVIDSNVDLFLRATGYPGPWTYEARRAFLKHLAERIDLSAMRPGLKRYNPRLVQQALYLFMSVSNRRASPSDCGNASPMLCGECLVAIRTICPRRCSIV